jgi:hypothetical protein
MSDLTDDEYSCLMIMQNGMNLIRMRNDRWHVSLTSLYSKSLIKPIGNENFVINDAGLQALAAHEKFLDADLGKTIEAHASITNRRQHVLTKMNEAQLALVEASRLAAQTTGESPASALRKCIAEVSLRAQEML